MTKQTKPEKTKKSSCTMSAPPCAGRDCRGCGFDRRELARRKRLPLVADQKTGLLRKFVGVKKEGG